jgi:hypothetical protein
MRDAVDACLMRAFRDVAVPAGLAERLLAGLVVERPLRRSRRWVLTAGGLAATAATILLAVWLGNYNRGPVSAESARNEAIQLFSTEVGQSGYLLAAGNAPSGYQFSYHVRALPGTTWRYLDDFRGYKGVVYDLRGPTGAPAALYVVACNNVGDGVGQSPDSWKDIVTTASSGCCASAWQENGLLYVLVVQGDQSDYEQCLKLPSSPVV